MAVVRNVHSNGVHCLVGARCGYSTTNTQQYYDQALDLSHGQPSWRLAKWLSLIQHCTRLAKHMDCW